MLPTINTEGSANWNNEEDFALLFNQDPSTPM
jgi:hypothetical protein